MFESVTELQAGDLTREEVFLAMGYGGTQPEDEVAGLVDETIHDAFGICRLRYMYQIIDAELLSRGVVRLGNTEFHTGGIISAYLEGMQKACLFVTTAGKEYNDYIHSFKQSGDILREFVADSVGSVIAELGVKYISARLTKDYPQMNLSLSYSPGYCAWNIVQQRLLFDMFPPEPCGIRLSDSCLMFPEKSVSGFIALGTQLVPQPYHCDVCTNQNCYKKRIKQ